MKKVLIIEDDSFLQGLEVSKLEKVGYSVITASSGEEAAKKIYEPDIDIILLDLILPASLLIKTLYTAIVYGVVGALALGIGLAIGLGGKDTAAKIISDIYRKIDER